MSASTFSPEARAELLAMYTGMAMQGLLAQAEIPPLSPRFAELSVNLADAQVSALEAWHARQALLDETVVSDVRAQ